MIGGARILFPDGSGLALDALHYLRYVDYLERMHQEDALTLWVSDDGLLYFLMAIRPG